MSIDALPEPVGDGSSETTAATAMADASLETTTGRAGPDGAGRDRRRALASLVVDIMARMIPGDAGLAVVLDEPGHGPGTVGAPSVPTSPDSATAVVRIHGADAVGRLVLRPTQDGFAEAFLRGDLDIDGDVAVAITAAQKLDLRRLAPADARRLVRYALELRRGTPSAPVLRRLARLRGRQHSRARDLEAVRFHYDVGESFFRLWLDRRLTYSCAYFERPDDPAADLDAAQEAKLDLICRKLDLRPGQRLLDIGCGWGSLILFAADRYKVDAVGVTLSERQAAEANRRAGLLGLAHRARAEVRDYRDLAPLGPFDAVASVGMFEHVGAANLRPYFAAARAALRPGGRFLNHGIATNERDQRTRPRRNAAFVEHYVFPDGELVPVERAIAAARDEAGLELLDVELLRPHYALTLQAWVERLERAWDAAVEAAGDEVARTWRVYMSGARLGFEDGSLDVAQLLLARPLDGLGPGPAGRGRDGHAASVPAPRPLRPWWT